jgi:hypothetical protein
MTIYTSHMISGAIGQQLGMFSGQMGYAQQLGYPMQQAMYPGMMPPPAMMMPQMTMMGAAARGSGGVYGEQLAMRMANAGTTAMGMGAAGLGLMGAMSGIPLDPFSAALGAGRMGFAAAGGGIGGLAVGGLAAGAAALPFYAAGKIGSVYAGAFTGGMTDQASLNSTLRNNFQFHGGQGAFGRGFGQAQMGQIGQMISSEVRSNPFTSTSEMNQLIAGGAEMGQFSGVRDVQQFTQNFRKMLNTLKEVQRELGGTLTDALQFVRGSQQAGIFRQADQVNFAAEVRSAEAVTGMDRNQLIALSAQGAQISRAYGGVGRQGAMGALRGVQQLGAAVQAGVVNQEALSEATGGLTGDAALQAFTTNMMQRTGAFSRRAMGRFSLFALSNNEGNGLDADMLERFRAGDLTTGEVSRTAHRNVNRMGRARALNREGMLRGALMEEGGMSAQIGMMRLMVGDRVLDQGDDLASLVLQRRFRMNRPESEMMVNLMRNQGSIAQEEAFSRGESRREGIVRREITENRSFDGFMRHLQHGLEEGTGVASVREMGRKFMTRISTLAERAMNDILGTVESQVTQQDRRSLNNLMLGRAGSDDIRRLAEASSGTGAAGLFDQSSLAQRVLGGIGAHSQPTVAQAMEARGVSGFRRMGAARAQDLVQQAMDARRGLVSGADADMLGRLNGNVDVSLRMIQRAQLQAGESGDFYRYMGGGVSANAADAFMAQNGFVNRGIMPSEADMMMAGRGGGRINAGMVARDIGRLATQGIGALFGDGLSTLNAMEDQGTNRRLAFISSGGHLGRALSRSGSTRGTTLAGLGGGVDGARRIAENLSVDESSVAAVMQSEQFSSALRTMQGMSGDREGLNDQIGLLRRQAAMLEDPGQQRAALSMIEQMSENVRRDGSVGREFSPALTREQRQRARELEMQLGQQGAQLRSLGRGLSDVGGGSGVAALFTRAGDLMTSSEGDREDNLQSANDTMAQARSELARMDPMSDEYRQMARAISQREGGTGILAGVAQERQLRRALSGRGRRGRDQAIETAFGMVTGGSIGSMSFNINGREIDGSRRDIHRVLSGALSRGGRGAADVQQQLQAQLEAQGLSEGDAGNLVQSLTMGVSGRGRGIDNADELIRLTETGEAGAKLRAIRERGLEQAQRAQNPLDTQRNDLLTQIRDAIRSGQKPEGQAPGEPA